MIDTKSYIASVLAHIAMGFLVYAFSGASKIIFLAVVAYFLFKIFNASPSKKTINVLLASAYIIGSEVFFRMTGGNFLYESSKYLVVLFMLIGIFFNGVAGKSYPYFIYLMLLLPSIVVSSMVLGYDLDFRKSVAFVLSGPVCLGIASLYCYNRRITIQDMYKVLLYAVLPIISTTTYLFLYSPSIKEVLTNTASNFAASGGFGPNQVSTVLGLGMFVMVVFFFLRSPSLLLKIINAVILMAISYRGIVTFSRGGILTAIIMIFAFLGIIYFKSNAKQKNRIMVTFVFFIGLALSIWMISSLNTEGLIDKRYANQDAAGREKEDVSTGRSELFFVELEGFTNNPIFGVGASGMKQYRLETEGVIIASHNEISRLLSEHGFLGIIILLILVFTPLNMWFKKDKNIFFFACLIFWFATINHSAMRIAAPGFIYALALLNIQYEKRSLRRKRIVQ